MATTVNPYKRFQELLGRGTKQIAVVEIVYNDGTSVVSVRGRSFSARGSDYPAGSHVWVVDGEIVSEAPDLPVYSVSV